MDAQALDDEQLFDQLTKKAESTELYTLACEARNRYQKLKANFKLIRKEQYADHPVQARTVGTL